jgi:hypothetical protein
MVVIPTEFDIKISAITGKKANSQILTISRSYLYDRIVLSPIRSHVRLY